VRTFACLLLFVIGGEQLTPGQNQPQSDLKSSRLKNWWMSMRSHERKSRWARRSETS